MFKTIDEHIIKYDRTKGVPQGHYMLMKTVLVKWAALIIAIVFYTTPIQKKN